MSAAACKNNTVGIAAEKAQTEPLRLLLAAGAAVNQTKNFGSSPLFIAAQEGRLESVRLLLRAEADPLLCWKGKTAHWSPLEAARAQGHAEIAELLQAAERGDKGALQDETGALAEQLAGAAISADPAPASEAGSSAAHTAEA